MQVRELGAFKCRVPVEGKGYKRLINLPDWQDMHKNIRETGNGAKTGCFFRRYRRFGSTIGLPGLNQSCRMQGRVVFRKTSPAGVHIGTPDMLNRHQGTGRRRENPGINPFRVYKKQKPYRFSHGPDPASTSRVHHRTRVGIVAGKTNENW